MNARAKIRKFTLIEMIVVLIIVGTMIGMSVGVVSILKTKETPKAGYRILTQMIYGSRSYALTKRSYVAIVLPTSSKLSDAQVAKQFATNENGNYAIAIRPFTISRDLQTLTPIKGSGWQYLPKGVYLDLTSTTNLEELSTVTIAGVTNQTCDAIIF